MTRSSVAAWVVCLAVLSFGPLVVAQSGGEPAAQPSPTPPQTASPPIQLLLTGCLKRANDGGYRLTDHNGITWQLSSTSVDLAEHVNHSVTITGKPTELSKQQAAQNQSSDSGKAGNTPRGLQVLTLKMLSNSCTR